MSSDAEVAASQDLLPGIPSDITLNNIIPKLSWRDFYSLSSVSRAWCYAIRSRRLYNKRLHQHSTEQLVLINYSFSATSMTSLSGNDIALYSVRDNSWYELPPIPDGTLGFPEWCQSVSLDGRIYVLGGLFRGSCKVFVLDVIGQKQWKLCANMIDPRAAFGCGVMDGKIYVFGGRIRYDHPVGGSEVYDPIQDTWSPIRTLPAVGHAHLVEDIRPLTLRYCHRVENMGEEFLLHEFDPDAVENSNDDGFDHATEDPKYFNAYNPAKDEWRVIQRSRTGLNPFIFMAQGRLHWMSRTKPFHIKVHNADGNSWTHLHSSTFASIGPGDSIVVKPLAVLALNDELLAIVSWRNRRDRIHTERFCLVRSKGLGSETEEIRWHKALELTHFKNKSFTGFSMSSFEL